tara:strand:- start:472 stop:729 length:258 start_codon:yes stop_codon:yes gene_type:complete
MSFSRKIEFIGDVSEEDFFCKLCGFALHTYDDFRRHKKYGCCTECYLTFVESRRKEWDSGWRPNKTTLEEYIYKRKAIHDHQEKK